MSKFTDSVCSPSQSASQYTDTDEFLGHSPIRESLYYKGPTHQNIILFWGEFPLIPVSVGTLVHIISEILLKFNVDNVEE